MESNPCVPAWANRSRCSVSCWASACLRCPSNVAALVWDPVSFVRMSSSFRRCSSEEQRRKEEDIRTKLTGSQTRAATLEGQRRQAEAQHEPLQRDLLAQAGTHGFTYIAPQ